MATKKSKKAPADWSLAPRGAVSATIQSTAGLVALAGGGHLAHVSPVWAAAGAGVGALGHVVVSAHHNHTSGALLYRLGCWAGAGGWLTWAWTTGQVWNSNGLAALAVGAVGAGVLSPLARHRNKPPLRGSAPGTAVVPRGGGRLGDEWQARIRRVTRVAVTVTGVRHWDNKAGYDVDCMLPPGPYTRRNIETHSGALAADARLPEGCGVESRPGTNRGSFSLAVTIVNRLGSASDATPVRLHCPPDYSPRSILDPIQLGEHRDGSPAQVQLREDCMLIVAALEQQPNGQSR